MTDVPEGWYPDPGDPTIVRFWTGGAWTQHTAPLDPKVEQRTAVARQKAADAARRDEARQRKQSAASSTTPAAAPSTPPTVAPTIPTSDQKAADAARRAADAQRKRDEAERVKAEKAQKREAIRASEARAAALRAEQKAEQDARVAELEAAYWRDISVIGGRVTPKAAQVIRGHSPGEKPWLVIASLGFAGVLAAWEDRLMIIKTGAITSFMAGSLGGGRITTFPFLEITGIEYNGQLISGVLEVLTPSYQGTANKDYWRGTTKSRNADSNDPFTLSNTLPLGRFEYAAALPQINELRAKILAAKSPRVVVELPAAAPTTKASVADELVKLAGLRDSGVLSEDEFQKLKSGLIAGT